MNLEYLKNFLCFAEHLNFTKAAESLYMAHTTLGRQIRSLEEQIGSKLYVQDKRSIKLTDAGIFLVSEGRKFLQQTEKLELSVRQIGEDTSLNLTMASVPVNHHYFSSIYSNFYKRHPNVKFTLLYKELGEISPLVTSGDVDFGLTYFFEMDEISNFDEQISDFAVVEIDNCEMEHDIILIWKKSNDNPAFHLFLNSLKNTC